MPSNVQGVLAGLLVMALSSLPSAACASPLADLDLLLHGSVAGSEAHAVSGGMFGLHDADLMTRTARGAGLSEVVGMRATAGPAFRELSEPGNWATMPLDSPATYYGAAAAQAWQPSGMRPGDVDNYVIIAMVAVSYVGYLALKRSGMLPGNGDMDNYAMIGLIAVSYMGYLAWQLTYGRRTTAARTIAPR